ncbi:SRPBCC domain-containing protein [Nocardia australiensis]|uniref:SRPBCC domain-containing protein n=1 Tax=Nocardia australiensis TaxID=2887191 RepID=UPI001D15047B|nr:SRPBCC domain-containing protein [Nocardia australiensis]
MTDTELLIDGARPAVRLERQLADPPPVVWQAITDRDQLRSWFPWDVEVAGGVWKVGATITFHLVSEDGEMTLPGEVFAVDEPKLLAFGWGEEWLRFELSPHGTGTRLVLIDELPPATAARNAAGWEVCLDRLAGIEPAPDAWQSHFDAYSAAFEPLAGPQDGPPTH